MTYERGKQHRMTWFKVDDTLAGHPKPRRAGLPAMGLWVVAGAFCGQNLTDGFVPEWYVASWPRGKQHAAALVDAGLWAVSERDGDSGWLFHEWHQANPTREEELQKREKRADAGRKGGLKSGSRRRSASTKPEANAKANASAVALSKTEPKGVEPRPDPYSVPKGTAGETESETANQQAGRVTKTYTDRVRLSNFMAVRGVVKTALAENTEPVVIAALTDLAEDEMPVTAASLLLAIKRHKPAKQRIHNLMDAPIRVVAQ